jgi:hypothetical protein
MKTVAAEPRHVFRLRSLRDLRVGTSLCRFLAQAKLLRTSHVQ